VQYAAEDERRHQEAQDTASGPAGDTQLVRNIPDSAPQCPLAPAIAFGDTLRVSEAAVANRACALCGQTGAPRYQGLADRLLDAGPRSGPVVGGWSLIGCPGCRLVWLDPMPDRQGNGKGNREGHGEREGEGEGDITSAHDPSHDAREADPVEESPLHRAVTRGIPAARMGYPEAPATDASERLLAGALSWIGPLREIAEQAVMWLPVSRCGRLLDVGCGSGVFLERMRDFGWQVSGVERDARRRAVATSRLGWDVLESEVAASKGVVVAGLEDERLAPESFDAITLGAVLEHVPDPVETLRQCEGLLAPGGLLVCITPNGESLGARSFGSSWLHWDPPRHRQLFGPTSLERAARKAGLEVQRVATLGRSAHRVWQASTLLEREGRLPDGSGGDLSPALWLESLAFWAFEYVLTRMGKPVGEELLLVAEKARA